MEKKITFSVKGFILQEGKFLVMKRHHPTDEIWELPGGHLEYGETSEEALIREMREEAGMAVEPLRLLDTWNAFIGNWQITGIIYQCRAGDSQVELSDEHSDYAWINRESPVFRSLHPAFRDRIAEWDWDAMFEGSFYRS